MSDSQGSELCGEVSLLMAAIQMKNYNRAKSLLGRSKNSRRTANCSCGPVMVRPLQLAASLGGQPNGVAIVKLLLEHGAEVNASDKYGRTPLYHAATVGCTEVVQLLLAAGADPNTRCTPTPFLPSRLSDSLDEDTCSRASAVADDLPLPECWGRTPLHQAVLSNHVACVRLLLQNKANINALDQNGCSPLLLAGVGLLSDDKFLLARYEANVELLVKHNLNVNKEVNVIKEDAKLSPLHQSVKLGSLHATKCLLDAGANVNVVTSHGENVFHIAATSGNINVLNLLFQTHAEVTINEPDNEGCTPLHKAAYQGNKECLKVLINNGGDLAAESHTRVTVVYAIFQHISRPTEFLRKILDSKIIPNKASINDRAFKIKLDFDVLAPKKTYKQMSVVSLLTEETKLVQHPLIEAFIHTKWKKMRWIFFILFVVHSCFVFSLSLFALQLVHPDWLAFTKNHDEILKSALQIVLICSALFLIANSFLQLLLMGPMRYQLFEPWVNFTCSLYGIWLAMDPRTRSKTDDDPWLNSLTHVASVVVLAAWGCLMYQLGRFPTWGHYGLMFSAVLTNVLKVLMTFICLVVGFVLCFCLQFPDKFQSPWSAVIKTTVMMAGELDDDALFKDREDDGMITSRLVFILFILLATVVLMNLMLGLAVNDVQELQLEGHAKRLKKQVEFVSHLERLTTHRLLQSKFIPRRIRQMLNAKHHVPTKLIIQDSGAPGNALPDRIVDTIVPIAKARRLQKAPVKMAKSSATAHSLDLPSSSSVEDLEATPGLRPGDGLGKAVASEILNSLQEIKHMLHTILDNNAGEPSPKSKEDADDGPDLNALLRRLSNAKRV